jgi:hypothetical protein
MKLAPLAQAAHPPRTISRLPVARASTVVRPLAEMEAQRA